MFIPIALFLIWKCTVLSLCQLGNALWASVLKPNSVCICSRGVLTGLSLDEYCWALETAWFQKSCCATNQSKIAQYAFTCYRGLSAQLWESSFSSQAEITSPSPTPGKWNSTHEAVSPGKVTEVSKICCPAGCSALSKGNEYQGLETAVFISSTKYLDSSISSTSY